MIMSADEARLETTKVQLERICIAIEEAIKEGKFSIVWKETIDYPTRDLLQELYYDVQHIDSQHAYKISWIGGKENAIRKTQK